MQTNLPLNFKDKLDQFTEQWSPKVIAEMNDYQFKLAKLQGEFVWHNHPETDETFIVLHGKMTILFRDNSIDLNAGEMFVVPKGVEHKPVAKQECHILLVEPRGVTNTGQTSSNLTAENDICI